MAFPPLPAMTFVQLTAYMRDERARTLRSGAGGAQVMDKTVPTGYWDRRFNTIGDADFLSAFDDPVDQAAIILGVDLHDSKAVALTADDLRDLVRTRAGKLSTKPATTP